MAWRQTITQAFAAVGAAFVAVRVTRALSNRFAPGALLKRAERELDKRDRALREEPPDSVALRHRAHYLSEIGDLAGAVELSEQRLAGRVRALGEDHPQVLTTRHNLANLRGRAGDVAGAAAEFEQLALDMERVHGPDYVYTTEAQRAAARWREKAEGDARNTEDDNGTTST
ncbi:tetratricopeptide repeat protein [Streptomyces sp. AJS327]|uniref:tetratricopeptide repeat protein n=1 Tax=Streptomyces sp. AJS327 TaxID=2545265 RepID=UPI0015DEDCD9|nr:tetratricopeptide repeat protein [Streptomyces sp. AJS327]MBA0049512.1 tetratricopeptide repeat protein [Streptomyces sp. AJS327]